LDWLAIRMANHEGYGKEQDGKSSAHSICTRSAFLFPILAAPGNIIQEAPLAVWANPHRRALDTAIAEINQKTDLNIVLESLERSGPRRVDALVFAIKAQGIP
jgi:hypothetical protein